MRAWAKARAQEERVLPDQLFQLPDLQCAWLLLALCAAPRANHALRTVPPPEVAPYAQMHDAAIWNALAALLGGKRQMPSPSCPQRWVAWAYCPPPVPHPQHIDLHSPAGTGEERRPYSTEDWGGACPPRMRDAGSGDWPHGWQSRIVNSQPLFRECRTLEPGLRRCLPAWPSPSSRRLALCSLRLQLPLPDPGCGGRVDGPQRWWFWALRWVAAGTLEPSACCATSSVSVPSALCGGILAVPVPQAVVGTALGEHSWRPAPRTDRRWTSCSISRAQPPPLRR